MKILFARHGESQANVLREVSNRGLKHPLSAQGRRQAYELADNLRGSSITRIYSSPVLRAIETTVIVADRLGVEYEVTEALREYDVGALEGRSDEEAWRLWREQFDAWIRGECRDQAIEGGETFYQVQARFVPFVEGLVRQYRHSNSSLLCVAHGGLYWLMLPLVLKRLDYDMIARHRGFGFAAPIVAELGLEGLVLVDYPWHAA